MSLEIKNLHAQIDNTKVLQGLDLTVAPGQVHAIMGPNGAGKSSLAHVLSGNRNYQVTQGTVQFNGQDLLTLDAEQRSRHGIFLAFQYPVEIPGLNNAYFLKAALNAHRAHRQEEELDAFDFLKLIKKQMQILGIDPKFLDRSVNEGFSGGEKKRNELLQMTLLEPKLAILDETDSGLDIDAMKVLADGVNRLRSKDRSFVVITHYQRLLDYIQPDFVHVLSEGRIVKSGDQHLARELDSIGYSWLHKSPNGTANPSPAQGG